MFKTKTLIEDDRHVRPEMPHARARRGRHMLATAASPWKKVPTSNRAPEKGRLMDGQLVSFPHVPRIILNSITLENESASPRRVGVYPPLADGVYPPWRAPTCGPLYCGAQSLRQRRPSRQGRCAFEAFEIRVLPAYLVPRGAGRNLFGISSFGFRASHCGK